MRADARRATTVQAAAMLVRLTPSAIPSSQGGV